MQSCLSDIIQQLEHLLRSTKVTEQKLLGQVLFLEKIVNNSLKIVPQITKKQPTKPAQKQQKKEDIKFSVESEVSAFLNEIQLKQKQLQNQHKPRLQVKYTETVVQKKPPIPTGNRAIKTSKNIIPTFIPPRNKNEVTGKVTQATIRTSAQKVFKPQITNSIRSNSKQAPKNKQIFQKSKITIEAKQQKKDNAIRQMKAQQVKKTQKVNDSKIIKAQNPNIQTKQPNKKLQLESKQKLNSKLAVFAKQVQQFLQQVMGKGTKNRKLQLQKLMKQIQNQEIGHKKNEEQARFSCIKQMNNYSHSRHRVNRTITHSILRSKWSYSPQIFQFELLIKDLENELQKIQDKRQYKLDIKQQYRIIKQFTKLQQLISQVQDKAKNVPDHLQMTFQYSKISNAHPEKEDNLSNLNEANLNEKLSNLVESIRESGTLQKSQLRCLQVLSQVGIFKCKKTPIVAMSSEYSSWKDYYFNTE